VDLGADSGFEVARQMTDAIDVHPGHVILISVRAGDDPLEPVEGARPSASHRGLPCQRRRSRG
jgi:hypothetical protein